jgi:hypothetical protein
MAALHGSHSVATKPAMPAVFKHPLYTHHRYQLGAPHFHPARLTGYEKEEIVFHQYHLQPQPAIPPNTFKFVSYE